MINAAIVAELTRELLEDYKINQQIFCITPYRAQYHLMWALLKRFIRDSNELGKVKSSSVHRVQGGEVPIVIYDLTDGRQKNFTGFIKTPECYIHNVAITRSKWKLVFVGDIDKLKGLPQLDPPKPSFAEILDNVLKVAKIIDAKPYKEKVFLNYTVEDLLNQSTVKLTQEQKNNIAVLASNTYYKFLENDILNANYSIFLVSPFITRNRWEKLKNTFLYFLNKNPQNKIKIITRPPENMFAQNQTNMAAIEILNEFLDLGLKLRYRRKYIQN